jgi:HEAT repeat protein
MRKTKADAGAAEARQRIRQALTGRGRGRFQVLEQALADGTAVDPQLLDQYVDALRDRYGDLVRLIATRILPAFGPAAAKKLRPQLNLKGKAADGWVLIAFSLADRKQGIDVCRRALREGSPAVRQAALFALRELAPDEARAAAVAVLQRRASLGQRRTAVDTLKKVGVSADAIPPLVQLLQCPVREWMLQHSAMEALKSGGRAAAEQVAPLLAHKDQLVRRCAAWALTRIGPEATPAIPGLCVLLGDPDWFNASCAAAALGAIGRGAAEAIAALEAHQAGTDPRLQVAIAAALFKITGNAQAALAVLGPAVLGGDIHARRDAALALGEMGFAARPAGPALLRLLRDRHLHGRHFAARALAAMDYDPATLVPLLIGMLGDDAAHYEQTAAIEALGRYGSAAKDALRALENLSRRKRSKYIREALEPALAAIRGRSAQKG